MLVYKFGGASVRDAAGVRNLAGIVGNTKQRLWVVVSALGKTTNALEGVVSALFNDLNYEAHLAAVEKYHREVAGELLGAVEASLLLDDQFDAVKERLPLCSREQEDYDLVYDQVVSLGEVWSTLIVEAWLRHEGIASEWIDARELLVTDARYRDANINWEESAGRVAALRHQRDIRVSVTQGFIGGTLEGRSTTLGREGSDFTAAVLANLLDAESVTIWKDVPGVLSADPGWIPGGERLERISYKEAVELSFSGAKVIHPKTIKPLHNKGIPLYVKSFVNPDAGGTVISGDESLSQDEPVFVRKENQVLVSLIPKDFSFVIGDHLGELFHIFYSYGIKTNLVQASAVSIAVCIDNEPRRIEKVSAILEPFYKILVNSGVEIVTIRHYREDSIPRVTSGRTLLLEQRTRRSVRLVIS